SFVLRAKDRHAHQEREPPVDPFVVRRIEECEANRTKRRARELDPNRLLAAGPYPDVEGIQRQNQVRQERYAVSLIPHDVCAYRRDLVADEQDLSTPGAGKTLPCVRDYAAGGALEERLDRISPTPKRTHERRTPGEHDVADEVRFVAIAPVLLGRSGGSQNE